MRERYGCRCGYCGISETSAGGELTIDHFRPSAAGGDDSDDNLVYACYRCNQYKGASWVHTEQPEERLLHPLLDDIGVHIRLNDMTGQLEPLTATGAHHIGILQLNRPALVATRIARRLDRLRRERLRLLQEETADLLFLLRSLEERIAAAPEDDRERRHS